jgi:hypothetical protein
MPNLLWWAKRITQLSGMSISSYINWLFLGGLLSNRARWDINLTGPLESARNPHQIKNDPRTTRGCQRPVDLFVIGATGTSAFSVDIAAPKIHTENLSVYRARLIPNGWPSQDF